MRQLYSLPLQKTISLLCRMKCKDSIGITGHSYIAKAQAAYLRQRRMSLEIMRQLYSLTLQKTISLFCRIKCKDSIGINSHAHFILLQYIISQEERPFSNLFASSQMIAAMTQPLFTKDTRKSPPIDHFLNVSYHKFEIFMFTSSF